MAWVHEVYDASATIELVRERPWASVAKVASSAGDAWLKLCRPVQAFEPRMTAALFERWPDRVVRVLAHDAERDWLLTADAGSSLGDLGNPPERWLEILPRYAELQRGEAPQVRDHLLGGVPDRRVAGLPALFDALLAADLPLDDGEHEQLRAFRPRFAALCRSLDEAGPADTVQHDDLHLNSVYFDGAQLRVLDWGDACIGHPFSSLVATFRFLEDVNGLRPGDPWFTRLRDAYLEPWGPGLASTFELAFRVGAVAHAIGWLRQREAMPPDARRAFNEVYAALLRWVLDRAVNGNPSTLPS
jgi:hypothetical protein